MEVDISKCALFFHACVGLVVAWNLDGIDAEVCFLNGRLLLSDGRESGKAVDMVEEDWHLAPPVCLDQWQRRISRVLVIGVYVWPLEYLCEWRRDVRCQDCITVHNGAQPTPAKLAHFVCR